MLRWNQIRWPMTAKYTTIIKNESPSQVKMAVDQMTHDVQAMTTSWNGDEKNKEHLQLL